MIKLSKIKPNEQNPRSITESKFKKLCESIEKFPEMMSLRPMVVDKNMVTLGGNMRLKALKHLGFKEIPDSWIIQADELTEAQKREFIVKDNVGFGDWDWDELANEYDLSELDDWAMDIPDDILGLFEDEKETEEKDEYSKKVESPVYEAKNEKPQTKELVDMSYYSTLVKQINDSDVPKKEKELLKLCATRHIVFNYSKIADYYAHSEEETQDLMENSALVIIDFNKALELGFVKLSEEIAEQYKEEYGDE